VRWIKSTRHDNVIITSSWSAACFSLFSHTRLSLIHAVILGENYTQTAGEVTTTRWTKTHHSSHRDYAVDWRMSSSSWPSMRDMSMSCHVWNISDRHLEILVLALYFSYCSEDLKTKYEYLYICIIYIYIYIIQIFIYIYIYIIYI